MSTNRTVLGACPDCETEIRHQHVLIAYESDGSDGLWAECPACGDVVDPE